MNILLVGNGFDLAHGLPTRYTDFLNFLRAVQFRNSTEYLGINDNEKIAKTGVHDEIKALLKEPINMHKWNIDEVYRLMNENVWVEYFLAVYKTLPKGGWVDFEHEISSIVQKLDELQDNNLRSRQKMQRISQLKVMPDILLRYNLYDNIPESLQNPDVSKRLLSDLDKLIRCLEIYLCCCLDLIDPSTHLKSITEIGAIDGVLSFNYTNTFEEIYEPKLSRKPEYCYIHGKARMENDIMLDNMVLGIDEYLDDVRKNEDTQFVRFKKYYQRIFKQTDYNYTEWFSRADLKNLYIIGHSLDITDRDVLRDIMTRDGVKTTIFYHNKQENANQITNLVKVLGYDMLNSLARGAERYRSIVFSQLL